MIPSAPCLPPSSADATPRSAAPSLAAAQRNTPNPGTTRPGDILFIALAAALLLASLTGAPLAGPAVTGAAAALMLVGGLPHGAHDVRETYRAFGRGSGALALWLGLYLATCGLVLAAWALAPAAMLGAFLAIATLHFGEDWEALGEPLFRAAAGAAIIAVPVLAHPDAVRALFVALAGPGGVTVAAVATMVAPVALLVAAVALLTAWQAGERSWAAAQAAALVLLATVPPVPAFALYFVLLHARHHDAVVRRSGGGALLLPIALAALALVLWWFVSPGFVGAQGIDAASAFRLLSVVAVPHILTSVVLDRRRARTAPRRAASVVAASRPSP